MSTEWQRSIVTLSWTVLTTVIVMALYWAGSVFIPIALAIFLAFVLAPVVGRLQRRGIGRTTAVILTMLGVLTVVGAASTVVASQLTSLAQTLPDHREAILQKVAAAKLRVVGDGNSRLGELINEVSAQIGTARSSEPNAMVLERQSTADWMKNYISPVGEVVGQGLLAFVLTIFILLKKEDLRNRMIRLLGDGKVTTTTRAVDDASTRLSKYLLMQLIINTTFGVLITIGLFMLGVKYSMLWGFIGSVMRYVPYIGTPLGLIFPVLFSFATAPEWGGGWGQPIAVFSLFMVLEMISNNIVEPRMYGKSMGLSEVAQIVAAGFWVFLWGPIGIILSGPIMVCLLVLGRHVRRFEFLEVLLGDRPALNLPVAFYQRLTARDRAEAAEIALTAAKESGTEACLNDVFIPALCIARRDLDDGDLDPQDYLYAIETTREIVAEVDELREKSTDSVGPWVRVLIVPARDKAEHVIAEAFAKTLDPERWEVKVAGDETLASEVVTMIEEFEPSVVVLATLPPGGVSNCRYLIGRLRAKYPDIKVIIARWGSDATASAGTEPIAGADGMDMSLSETRKRLEGLHAVLEKIEPTQQLA